MQNSEHLSNKKGSFGNPSKRSLASNITTLFNDDAMIRILAIEISGISEIDRGRCFVPCNAAMLHCLRLEYEQPIPLFMFVYPSISSLSRSILLSIYLYFCRSIYLHIYCLSIYPWLPLAPCVYVCACLPFCLRSGLSEP